MANYSDWWNQADQPTTAPQADIEALIGGDFTSLHKHLLVAGTPVNAVVATLSTNLTGTNNDLVFTANTAGAVGNAITIAYVDPAEETAEETVTVTGSAIVVTLRSVSSVLSTAAQVEAAIEAEPDADALVSIANKAANDGTGVVIALTATHVAGGIDGTIGTAFEARVDTSYLYVCTADNTIADGNWKRISLGSAY